MLSFQVGKVYRNEIKMCQKKKEEIVHLQAFLFHWQFLLRQQLTLSEHWQKQQFKSFQAKYTDLATCFNRTSPCEELFNAGTTREILQLIIFRQVTQVIINKVFPLVTF